MSLNDWLECAKIALLVLMIGGSITALLFFLRWLFGEAFGVQEFKEELAKQSKALTEQKQHLAESNRELRELTEKTATVFDALSKRGELLLLESDVIGDYAYTVNNLYDEWLLKYNVLRDFVVEPRKYDLEQFKKLVDMDVAAATTVQEERNKRYEELCCQVRCARRQHLKERTILEEQWRDLRERIERSLEEEQ